MCILNYILALPRTIYIFILEIRWILYQLLFAIISFLPSSFIRYVSCIKEPFDYFILDFSSIAFSCALLCIYNIMKITEKRDILDNSPVSIQEDSKKTKESFIAGYIVLAFIFLTYFFQIESFQLDIYTNQKTDHQDKLPGIMIILSITIFIFLLITRRSQKALKLSTNIL